MTIIYKYELNFEEVEPHEQFKVSTYPGTVLYFGPDVGGIPCLWIRHEEDDLNIPAIERKFMIIFTGHKFDPGWEWVATWSAPPLMCHLHEWEPYKNELANG